MSEECRAAALRILQFRFNSEAELRRKLRSKQFDKADIDATIERLRDEKWVDDRRFAEAFVRSRIQKRLGPDRIRRELIGAGVDGDVAADAIVAHGDPERDRTALMSLLAKRRRSLERRHGPDFLKTDDARNKLAAWLLKQGYDAALVFEVMRATANRTDTEDREPC